MDDIAGNDRGLVTREFEIALATYERAESDYEGAMMSGDAARQIQTRTALRQAASTLAQARSRLLADRTSAAPSFEELLRDPWSQMDTSGVVLDSIRQYWAASTRKATTASRDQFRPAASSATGGVFRNPLGGSPLVAAGGRQWQQEAPTPGRVRQQNS